MPNYMFTLTRSGGLTQEQLEKIKSWFSKEYQNVVLNVESHKSGLLHLHAFVESDCKNGGSLHKKLTRYLISECGFEMHKRSLNVKAADEGGRNYVIKDVSVEKPVSLCQGWSIAELLKSRQEALKKLTTVQLKGSDRMICQDEAVPLIIRFAKDEAVPLTDKESFKHVCKSMCRQGYSFARLKMACVYSEVMCRVGDDHAFDDWLENQLMGLR